MDRRAALLELWDSLAPEERKAICADYFSHPRGGRPPFLEVVYGHLVVSHRHRLQSLKRLPIADRGRMLEGSARHLPFRPLMEVLLFGLNHIVDPILDSWIESSIEHYKTLFDLFTEQDVSPDAIAALAADLLMRRRTAGQELFARRLLMIGRMVAPQSSLFEEGYSVDEGVDSQQGVAADQTEILCLPEISKAEFVGNDLGIEKSNILEVDEIIAQVEPVGLQQQRFQVERMARRPSTARHDAFDNMLIREVVRALANPDDSTIQSELDSTLQILPRISPERSRNYYIVGFADAVLPIRKLNWDQPLLNQERRCWYLLGAFNGYWRRGEKEACARLLTELSGVLDDTVSSTSIAENIATAWVIYGIEAAYELGRFGWVRRLLNCADLHWDVAAFAYRRVVDRIVVDVRACLAAAQIDSASQRYECIADIPMTDSDSEHYDKIVETNISWLWGGLKLASHSYEAAYARFNELIGQLPTDCIPASWLVDRGLASVGYRTLAHLGLPKDPTGRRSLQDCLEKGEQDFLDSLQTEKSGNALIALAMLSYLRWGSTRDQSSGGVAKKRIADALAGIPQIEGDPDFSSQNIVATLSFMMAVLLADMLDESAVHEIRRYIEAFRNIQSSLPSDDLRSLLEGLAVIDPDAAADLVVGLASAGVDTHEYLKDPALLEKSIQIQIVAKSKLLSSTMKPRERWAIWLALAMAYERQKLIEESSDALDELFGMAMKGDQVDETLNIYRNGALAEDVIGRENLLQHRAELLLSINRKEDATNDYVELFHRAKTKDSGDARLLVDDMREFQLDSLVILDLLKALPPDPSVASKRSGQVVSDKRCTIIFVGGDERQERNQVGVKDELIKYFPNVSVKFLHPGWGANYQKTYDEVYRSRNTVKAMVIMTFVRTNLGRLLRGINELPWVSCTGHGRNAIYRSLFRAAEIATGLR